MAVQSTCTMPKEVLYTRLIQLTYHTIPNKSTQKWQIAVPGMIANFKFLSPWTHLISLGHELHCVAITH